MHGAARGLRDLAIVLPALALLALALAVGLSRGRRSRALTAAGLVGVGAGLATLIVRSLSGTRLVDELAKTEAVRPAASAAWSILTSLLVELSVATICIGALVVLAGLLGGRSRSATATREALAPYLRDRADLVFAATGVVLLLVFLWGPIAATQKLLGIVVLVLLALLGVELLRRQTAGEFPDARYLPERDGVRGRVAGARKQLGRRGSRLRSGLAGAAAATHARDCDDGHARRTQPPAVDQLERLAALHASGALTDEEFAAAKRELLAAKRELLSD
jgi:hypothetical protein